MKTLFTILLILAMAWPIDDGNAMAEDTTTSVTFDWTAPASDAIVQATKFTLYKRDQPVCTETNVTLRSFSCVVAMNYFDVVGNRAEAPFSLTVTDNRGVESEHSNEIVAGIDIGGFPSLGAPIPVTIQMSLP